MPWFDDDVLAEMFRHEVFAMLLRHQRINPTTIETMLAWRFHGGFSVHSQTRLSPQDREGMEQVARYTARNPFAQEQLEVSDTGMVVFHHKGKPSPSGQDHEVLHPLEFLARACQHIPDAYEPRTFFFGLYSCRSRARERRFDAHPAISDPACSPTPDPIQPDTPFRRQCRKRWAELIRPFDPSTSSGLSASSGPSEGLAG